MAESQGVPETVPEDAPDVIATPEGDNEFAPDEAIETDATITRPRGDEPHSVQPERKALE